MRSAAGRRCRRTGTSPWFGKLCLVKPANDDDWYMGSLNDDGSAVCWSAYSDLYEALRGL